MICEPCPAPEERFTAAWMREQAHKNQTQVLLNEIESTARRGASMLEIEGVVQGKVKQALEERGFAVRTVQRRTVWSLLFGPEVYTEVTW